MAASKYLSVGMNVASTIDARMIVNADENVDSESKGRKSAFLD